MNQEETAFRVQRHIKDLRLQAYCNSDWDGCRTIRQSISGFGIFLGNSIISCKSGKQSNVSISSEVEYQAMTNSCLELTWLRYILQDLKVPLSEPVLLYCDNPVALHISANPIFHEGTKHIEIDCHIVRKNVQTRIIKPYYVSTKIQLARSPLVFFFFFSCL